MRYWSIRLNKSLGGGLPVSISISIAFLGFLLHQNRVLAVAPNFSAAHIPQSFTGKSINTDPTSESYTLGRVESQFEDNYALSDIEARTRGSKTRPSYLVEESLTIECPSARSVLKKGPSPYVDTKKGIGRFKAAAIYDKRVSPEVRLGLTRVYRDGCLGCRCNQETGVIMSGDQGPLKADRDPADNRRYCASRSYADGCAYVFKCYCTARLRTEFSSTQVPGVWRTVQDIQLALENLPRTIKYDPRNQGWRAQIPTFTDTNGWGQFSLRGGLFSLDSSDRGLNVNDPLGQSHHLAENDPLGQSHHLAENDPLDQNQYPSDDEPFMLFGPEDDDYYWRRGPMWRGNDFGPGGSGGPGMIGKRDFVTESTAADEVQILRDVAAARGSAKFKKGC
ncbi:hypothetical protein TWF192_001914 [Orbilia oligospora]|uniref:Uncharacterized protein n=2 Tax=Orbilia oligospora TaxID=2813651 RepID=A0A6G1MGT3_ORBOL|nr:hypothetical protein TWF679_002406 [Orbilia oligospora]KAF3256490.1 hypothetical protein TWF192_001914 [Orbilia oligospora]